MKFLRAIWNFLTAGPDLLGGGSPEKSCATCRHCAAECWQVPCWRCRDFCNWAPE
jgi:hypothetical protein